MIIVDACVAVKWFIPEPMSDEAEALLAGVERRAAPEHILVEVGNTLIRVYRGGGMTLDHAQQSIEALSELLQLVPTWDLAGAALRIAADVSCTNYDALYLAAAGRTGAHLVTADRRLVMQARTTRWQDRVRLLGRPGHLSESG